MDAGQQTGDPANSRIRICGIPVDLLTMDQSIAAVVDLLESGKGHQHVAINAAKVVLAHRDPRLRDAIEQCSLANADGQSIVWAGRLLGYTVPERVTGIDLMLRLWDEAATRGYRVFLLGSRTPIVQAAAEAARARGVEVVGTRSGFWNADEENEVVAEIGRTKPDLLFVGLPTPRKEEFLHSHLEDLHAGLAIGVGGSFDVVAGQVKRAPRWMQRAGLEWAYRIKQEPKRIFRHYFFGNFTFVWLFFGEWWRTRKQRRQRRQRGRGWLGQ